MATTGAVNNANIDSSLSPNSCYFCGFQFPATGGELTNVHMYLGERWAPGAWRFGIKVGGALDDPNGASKIFDSGAISGDLPGTPPGWYDAAGGFALSPSGTLTGSAYTWFFIKSPDEITIYSCLGADAGNLLTHYEQLSAIGNDPSVAFPSTVTGSGGGNLTGAFKFYLTYTESGSGVSKTTKIFLLGVG